MGLDGVALVIACEDRFGIEIEDREAEGCFTVADLQDAVVRKVGAGAAGTCHSMRVFHRLRGVLTASSVLVALLVRLRPNTVIPRDLETVGDLVRSVVALNYLALNERAKMMDSEVREAVAQVVCEELGVSRKQVKPASRFVADLGMD